MRTIPCRLAIFSLSLLTTAHALAQDMSVVQRVVFTSGVSGEFGVPECTDTVDFTPARFAPYAASLVTASLEPNAFAFDTGGFFEPHGTGRFALEADREALVSLVRALGYDALSFAVKDLQGPRTPITLLAGELMRAGLPFTASNLQCAGDARGLCAALDDAEDPIRIHESGSERVAFISLIAPSVMTHVAEENRTGISLEPLLDAMHRRIAEAHAGGATLTIVSIDNGASARATGDTLALVETLPEADRPDLIVSARAGGQLLYARPTSFRPPIAAAPPGRGATVEVRRRADDVGLEMLVRPLPPSAEPSTALSEFAATVGAAYCDELGHPLPGGTLATPIDVAGFADLIGGAMRVATDTEIAVINLGAVSDAFARPAGYRLTASDTHVGVQFDEPMSVASVDAAWLTSLARAVAARTDVRMIGVAIANPGAVDEAVTINGRPIDSRGHYRIVTARYLASGGEELLPEGAVFETFPGRTVRSALIAWLESPRTSDPRDAFPNPAEHLEWSFAFASDASFGASLVEARDPAVYTDAQFARADSVTYGTQNQLDLVARSTRLAWENQALARYRTSRTRGEAAAESDDLISLRSTFAWIAARVAHPHWYVPEATAEGYLETEFTRARDERHFLIRPSVGARFTFNDYLSLKLQVGAAIEAFGLAPSSPGAGTVLTLNSWKFFESGTRNGTLAATADWFVSGLGTSPIHTIRGNLDVGLQLTTVLGVSVSTTLYGSKQAGNAFASVVNTTFNLRLSWFVRTQN